MEERIRRRLLRDKSRQHIYIVDDIITGGKWLPPLNNEKRERNRAVKNSLRQSEETQTIDLSLRYIS